MPEVLHWRDDPAVRMATERLERGREALEEARAALAEVERRLEPARVRAHEVGVAVQLGEQPPAALEEARAALAEIERRLEQAREVAEAAQGALEVLARRRDEATTRARGGMEGAASSRSASGPCWPRPPR
jgi:F0F1-type ATP synthase membrane subunit b/b'